MIDNLNLDVVRKQLSELFAKGAHGELLVVVLALLENLDARQLQLLLSLVGESDRPAPESAETWVAFDDRLDGELDEFTDEQLEQAEDAATPGEGGGKPSATANALRGSLTFACPMAAGSTTTPSGKR